MDHIALLAASGKVPGLREFCNGHDLHDDMARLRHFHPGWGWADGCPGYSVVQEPAATGIIVAWLVASDWYIEHTPKFHWFVSLDGLEDGVDSVEGGHGATLPAALCSALGLKEE
jgi:hypothetical protein